MNTDMERRQSEGHKPALAPIFTKRKPRQALLAHPNNMNSVNEHYSGKHDFYTSKLQHLFLPFLHMMEKARALVYGSKSCGWPVLASHQLGICHYIQTNSSIPKPSHKLLPVHQCFHGYKLATRWSCLLVKKTSM